MSTTLRLLLADDADLDDAMDIGVDEDSDVATVLAGEPSKRFLPGGTDERFFFFGVVNRSALALSFLGVISFSDTSDFFFLDFFTSFMVRVMYDR
jgi:hypothetical protein